MRLRRNHAPCLPDNRQSNQYENPYVFLLCNQPDILHINQLIIPLSSRVVNPFRDQVVNPEEYQASSQVGNLIGRQLCALPFNQVLDLSTTRVDSPLSNRLINHSNYQQCNHLANQKWGLHVTRPCSLAWIRQFNLLLDHLISPHFNLFLNPKTLRVYNLVCIRVHNLYINHHLNPSIILANGPVNNQRWYLVRFLQ